MKKSLLFVTALLSLLTVSDSVRAQVPPENSLISNGDFQIDLNTDGTPDGWGTAKDGVSYLVESDNRYLHLVSETPGKMVLAYRQIPIPEGVKALELTWKQRATDLKPGRESWYDARIMLDMKDAADNKMKGSPGAPYIKKDTHGWMTKSQRFLVPEGAKKLDFIPALFQVQSGTFDLDDISLTPTDPAPIEAENQRRAQANALRTAKRDEQLNQNLALNGSFIANGTFEADTDNDGLPDKWSKPKAGISYENEAGNHFLRLTSPEKFQMLMSYHLVFLPSNVKALEITWKQRVSNLKAGEESYHDARIMTDFTDDTGHKTRTGPTLSATKKNSAGWEQKSQLVLLPERSGGLAFMPTLFKVESGIFDLDDISIKPTGPAPLLTAEGEKKRTEIK